MKIENDNFINNATYKYLYPILRKHGENYDTQIRKIAKQGLFSYDADKFYNENAIFMLVDVAQNNESQLGAILDDLRDKNFIMDIYIYSVEKTSKKPSKIVAALRFPEGCEYKTDLLFSKNYMLDKMYTKEEIEKYFTSNNYKLKKHYLNIRNVLTGKTKDNTVNILEEILNF